MSNRRFPAIWAVIWLKPLYSHFECVLCDGQPSGILGRPGGSRCVRRCVWP